MSARGRILAAIRAANADRDRPLHPGAFESGTASTEEAAALFVERFAATGGQPHPFDSSTEAAAWLASFASGFRAVASGVGVPEAFRPDAPEVPPPEAALGISWARGAVAETGSLALDARDGRRVQLLPPTHVVLLRTDTIERTLADGLRAWRPDLPSAIGLHSGPSKSADIGQMMVEGVHGPGRLIALLFPAA